MQHLVALNRSPRTIERPEPFAGLYAPFDRSRVLLQVIVQVGTGSTAAATTQLPLPLPFRHHLRIGGVAVYVDHPRAGMSGHLQSSLEEVFGGSRIPRRRKPKVEGGAHGIDGAIKIGPGACHPDIGFVYPPGTVSRLQFPRAPLVEFRCIPLHPTPNGGVVCSQTSFTDKLLDIAIREGISQIPTDRTKNDRGFEVPLFQ